MFKKHPLFLGVFLTHKKQNKMEAIVLDPIYTGRVIGTNKKAYYSIDNGRKTCKRLTPISFEYVLDTVKELTEELIIGNLRMLERILKKKNFEMEVDYDLKTLKIGKTLLFSSSDEGIAVVDRERKVRENLRTGEEIENFLIQYKERKKEEASTKRAKGMSAMGSQRDYGKEKAMWEKYKHLLVPKK